MPETLPRREIKPESETAYREEERSLGLNDVKNTTPPGIAKVPVVLAADVIARYTTDFRATRGALDRLATFGGGIGAARAAMPLKEKAQAYRGDLAGYWNDLKHEISNRIGLSSSAQADARLNQALDWLESAELKGGLGRWLDRWNETVGSSWSWDMPVDILSKIQQAIEFNKSLVDGAFGDLSSSNRNDPSVQNRFDLHCALDAIAAEIARQAGELLSGGRVNAGGAFDAVKDRLKEQSLRAGIEERLHTALDAGTLSQTYAGELPQPLQNTPEAASLARYMGMWESAAADVTQLVESIASGTDPDGQLQEDLAGTLDNVARSLIDKLDALKYLAPRDNADQASIVLFITRQIASEIRTKQASLAAQLSEPKARKYLVAGKADLHSFIGSTEALEPTKSVYFSSKEFASQSRLGDFWRQGREYVSKALTDKANRDYDPKLATQLEKALGSDLDEALDRWSKRKTDDTYGLAWQLTAKLRAFRTRVEAILAKLPERREFLTNCLEGITDAVASELDAELSDGA